jgi:branched-chain amino acid transport system permease protein
VYFLQQTVNGVALGLVLALFAVGFSLVLANLGIFNVAHAAVFASGPVVAYLLVLHLGISVWVGWVIAIPTAAAINALIYLIAVRPLRARSDRELSTFAACLGALTALQAFGDKLLNQQTVRFPPGALKIHPFHFAGLSLSNIQVLMIVLSLASFAILGYVINRTFVGRQIRAVAFDREASEFVGVNSELVTVLVFVVSGAMAALAAVPISLAYNNISGELGSEYIVLAMAVMVLGGFGSVYGTLIASVALGIVNSLTAAYISSSYSQLIVFGALLLTLVVRPTGIAASRVADRV